MSALNIPVEKGWKKKVTQINVQLQSVVNAKKSTSSDDTKKEPSKQVILLQPPGTWGLGKTDDDHSCF